MLALCLNCFGQGEMKLRHVYKMRSKSLRHVVVCEKCGINGPVSVFHRDAKDGWNNMNTVDDVDKRF